MFGLITLAIVLIGVLNSHREVRGHHEELETSWEDINRHWDRRAEIVQNLLPLIEDLHDQLSDNIRRIFRVRQQAKRTNYL